jgi:hypothetical protein
MVCIILEKPATGKHLAFLVNPSHRPAASQFLATTGR